MKSVSELLTSVNSWQQLERAIEALPNEKQKGDCFEIFVCHYLRLDPKYATKLRHVWLLSDVPHAVRDGLALPHSDEGIDLVGETTEGRYWAIQAKYRGPSDASLTRSELSTFTDLAFTICKSFDLALVCTTADRFSYKLELYGTRVALCTGDTWRQLDADFFVRLANSLRGQPTPPSPLTPRAHQSRAIESARRHYIDDSQARGKLLMPCGTGKSLAGYWIARAFKAQRVLVAVPSLALVRQTLLVWARECLANEVDVHWIAVCSDPSVGDPDADDTVMLTQDFGVDVTTDPLRVAEWLRRDWGNLKIVFCTYQSGRVLSAAAAQSGFAFDLAILDEAHRTVGNRDSLFSHFLFDDNVRINRRVFMTATERSYTGSRNNKIVGMDDTTVYGEIFEMLSFRAALEAEPPILADYRIVTMLVTRAEIDALIERNAFVRPEGDRWTDEVEAQMLAAMIALRKTMLEFGTSHVISFHSSIAKARFFAESQDRFSVLHPEFGPLDVYHVSGDTKAADRDQRLRAFAAADKALVTNARCLSEGVDVPDIDGVLFADPKRSTVDIVQAVGRALRPSRRDKVAHIVIPIEVEDINTPAAQEVVFESVLGVLRALAANDDRIIEYFRTVSAGKPWAGGTIPFEIKVPVGTTINTRDFINAIELECWSRLGKLAWRPFEEAREFVRSLRLKTRFEWSHYCYPGIDGKPTRPPDVPTAPDLVYRGLGWAGYADWLGHETRRPGKWRPFDEARQFARSLKLKNGREWYDYTTGRRQIETAMPDDIPSSPHDVYPDSWAGWGDFLGTGNVKQSERVFRPFEAARQFARSLRLRDRAEWYAYIRGNRPDLPPPPTDIPRRPHHTYARDGWAGVGDWLGTGKVRFKTFLPFEEARAFVRSLQLRTTTEWSLYCAGKLPEKGVRPDNIPSTPAQSYRGQGFKGIPDWIGNGKAERAPRKNRKSWRQFEEARTFARTLGLRSGRKWKAYCRGQMPDLPSKPDDIPEYPERVYLGLGWSGYPDWVGKTWRNYDEARDFARSLNLTTADEWDEFTRGERTHLGTCPPDVPRSPEYVYLDSGWKSWPDFLGTTVKWRPFADARQFARELKLESRKQWTAYCRGILSNRTPRPDDLPTHPNQFYRDRGWISWQDWLGCKKSHPGRKRKA